MTAQRFSFNDTAVAFAAKSDLELKKSFYLFKAIGHNRLVRILSWLAKTGLQLHLPIKGIIRSTVFQQFCGGETIEDCTPTIMTLGKYRVGTILDYSVEGKEREEDFENTMQQILACIEKAHRNEHIPFSVFKPTGMARMGILEKVSNEEVLNEEEQVEFENVKRRFEKVCGTAFEKNVPIFIDAEETWIQVAIDKLVQELMMQFNRREAIVYNTIQLYRTDRLDFLRASYAHAIEHNYYLGLKLVRGAYMEKERERAAELGYPSPILPDKAATDKAYDDAIRFCLEHIERIAVCAGAHNEQSALLLTKLMSEQNIANNHPHIWFSQLYGMSDHISFNLAKAGYNVCKYVPYGPVSTVLPYLIRRAQENTSVKGQTGRELSLLSKEMKRRRLATD